MKVKLENFDSKIHQWKSVAKEPLPLKAHQFDPEKCTLSVCFLSLYDKLILILRFLTNDCFQAGAFTCP